MKIICHNFNADTKKCPIKLLQLNYYRQNLIIIFLRDFIHKKIKTLKNFKIKSKENKISHGRENSLRNLK